MYMYRRSYTFAAKSCAFAAIILLASAVCMLYYLSTKGRNFPDPCFFRNQDVCYRPFIDENRTVREEGVPFAYELVNLLPPERTLELPKNKYKFENLVLVTYGSRTFFKQMLWSIKTWKPLLSSHKMVVFDLGLNSSQISQLEAMKGISVMKFDFSKYPHHVAILGQRVYGFKGALLLEAYERFEFFLFMDSSIRLNNLDILKQYTSSVLNDEFPPLSIALRTAYTNTQMTHFGMYKYLPIRKEINDRQQFGSGVIVVKRSKFASTIVKWFALCALTRNCIAPPGSFQKCPIIKKALRTICHRYGSKTGKNWQTAQMCYRPFIDENRTVREEGVPFARELMNLLPPEGSFELSKNKQTFENLVLVTYGSRTFFKQLLWSIETWKPLLSSHKMVVFDLGLNSSQISQLEAMQGINVMKFDFSKYPHHVAILGQRVYGFKGALLLEAYKRFEFFLFMDTSIRLKNLDILKQYTSSVLNVEFPSLSITLRTSYTNTQMTHFGMYKYLPIRKEINDRQQFGSGVIVVKRSKFASTIVKWYDQSALNILIRNQLLESPHNWTTKYEDNKFHAAFLVKRDADRVKMI